MDFIAFDLETTGTVPGVDKIVEIGAVRFVDFTPSAIFATLVDPERSMPPGATKVNNITDDMLVGKPKIDTLLDSFAEFCGDLPVVAHNAPFDAQFLTSDIKKHETSAPRGIILDTLPIARKVIPGLPNYRLGTLVAHFGIETTDFHRAEEDASYCGKLFIELLKKVSGGHQQPAIENIVALTGRPESRFPQVEKTYKQLSLL